MKKTPPAAASESLHGSALFYSKPEALNNSLHAKLGIRTIAKPFGFAAKTNAIPLTVTEFVAAASSYPIIFTAEEYMPLAVTGITTGQNLFVDGEGGFKTGAYIPAYVRRFPFIVAEDSEAGRFVVCVERNSELVSEDADLKLFADDGQPSAFTQGCIDFCSGFEGDRQRTVAFVDYLKGLNIFDERKITQPVMGEDNKIVELPLTTILAVSEDKLAQLPTETFIEMRDNGALLHIYAHLVSQANWDKLLALRTERESQGPANDAA